jgi:cytochrome c oxidase subunit 2
MSARRFQWLATAIVAAGLVLFPGCAENAPQDSLDPAGPFAREIDALFRPVFWIAAGVFVLVEGLLVVALIRFRHRPGRGVPMQVHGNKRLEIAWTIAPALLLAVIAVPTVGTIFSLDRRPADALEIRVTAHQWWWEVEYPSLRLLTANEIHIPVGQPAFVTMESVDVIHSFWVPRLAGKQDVVPGRTTHLSIQADSPGRYEGQCAEYCGASHANMQFLVFADDRAQFDAWVQGQQREPPPPSPDVQQILSAAGCGGCHVMGGVQGASGRIGPSLSHFGSRTTLAAGMFPNTRDELTAWLDDPPDRKPEADMPDLGLSQEQIDALVAYLEGLD